ncbi:MULTISPECIES: bifunctional riboflavin kinase/FAD synthetase [Mesonia]|uniref:Riboflavin biosynthesis protein RibF n=1 Tax=Mesonia oceanica TaxID=2687242 RepID=A0AC61Y3N5_9FLAO|nr:MULTISPECIES: bifunctional riboflavin kinase/FAD synthetase [Mesonia]MAN26919.1 riboflavin biosynthesis protein RibF [Mesonia sp.]MAQ40753.1 riboflavin biosynthesis protein RibF [Mesonia sp.]MBJ98458.1 riboflavin biosynthesis protein RibF [Flavobacteriaceae bacterium]VVU99080.1 Riboflavin biosynthesis protein RibF [Mesonia oceanica]|tara:strand:- start:1986 stop:2894 length:909 start_codon:yes stop_codon:yes gene_type:complete
MKKINNSVVTIGTFDGVHLGHRKIIKRLVEAAQDSILESAVLTFFPHPRMVLQKEVGIELINTIEERKQILLNTGIDHLIVYPFTKEFSRLSAKEYIEEVLVKKLHAKKVIIGYDHRFGRNRNANIEDLRKYGKEYGFEVEEISKQDVDEVAVSSTKIRKALQEGNIEKANSYLGSHFLLTGKIVKGKGIGKDLGFPTANLKIEEAYKLIPKTGVYVVKAEIDNEEVFGMMNIGYNPTVGGSEKTIETYFFNLDKNLYGKQLQIKMLKRIREEKKFSGLEELIKAMKKDEEFSINYINQLKS